MSHTQQVEMSYAERRGYNKAGTGTRSTVEAGTFPPGVPALVDEVLIAALVGALMRRDVCIERRDTGRTTSSQ